MDRWEWRGDNRQAKGRERDGGGEVEEREGCRRFSENWHSVGRGRKFVDAMVWHAPTTYKVLRLHEPNLQTVVKISI